MWVGPQADQDHWRAASAMRERPRENAFKRQVVKDMDISTHAEERDSVTNRTNKKP